MKAEGQISLSRGTKNQARALCSLESLNTLRMSAAPASLKEREVECLEFLLSTLFITSCCISAPRAADDLIHIPQSTTESWQRLSSLCMQPISHQYSQYTESACTLYSPRKVVQIHFVKTRMH